MSVTFRDADMLQRVLAGETAASVARSYGLTRERVRQIVTGLDSQAIALSRAVRREARRVRVEVQREQRRAARPPDYGIPKHGAHYCYVYYRCRCDDCRAAHRTYQRQRQLARREQPIPATVPHGRASTYSNWSCRCQACTTAWSTHMKAYKAQRRATHRSAS